MNFVKTTLRRGTSQRILFTQGIECSISPHGLSQFEIVINYLLFPHLVPQENTPDTLIQRKNRSPHIMLNFYLFFPRNLNINELTFPSHKIYLSTKNFVRLHTPPYDSFELGDLPITNKYFNKSLGISELISLENAIIQEIQLFSTFINSKTKYILQGIKGKNIIATSDIISLVNKVQESINNFRMQYLAPIMDPHTITTSTLEEAFSKVDEYIGIQLEALCKEMTLHLKIVEINDILQEERRYLSIHYPRPSRHEEKIKREEYFHRRSNLKKFVSKALYLDRIPHHREKFYSNLIAAIAASLAALWANIITLRSNWAGQDEDLGVKFYFMLFVAVGAYVFKDRIKEISKEYFQKKLKKFIPDYEYHFNYDHYDQNNTFRSINVLRTQDNLGYIHPDSLPDDVSFIKNDIMAGEYNPYLQDSIYQFSKRVWMDPDFSELMNKNFTSFKDIIRFNIQDFIQTFDNSTKEVADFSESDQLILTEAPKLYYFDFIIKIKYSKKLYSNSGRKDSKEYTYQYQAHRLVLDKKGLIRIEEIFKAKV